MGIGIVRGLVLLLGVCMILGGFAGNENSADQRNPVANVTILSGDFSSNDLPSFQRRTDNARHIVTR